MSGWGRIERKLFRHPFFPKEPMSQREAWIWMWLVGASWQDRKLPIGLELVDVPRGSFLASNRQLMNQFRWRSINRVQHFLRRLEAAEMIRLDTSGRRTLITILNYERYQDAVDADELETALPTRPAPRNPHIAELIAAMGNPKGCPNLGGAADVVEVERWSAELGLSLQEQVSVLIDRMRTRRSGQGPPKTLRYFSGAMQDRAAHKKAEALTPTGDGKPDEQSPSRRDTKSRFKSAFLS